MWKKNAYEILRKGIQKKEVKLLHKRYFFLNGWMLPTFCPHLVFPQIEGHSFPEVMREWRSDHSILSRLELFLHLPPPKICNYPWFWTPFCELLKKMISLKPSKYVAVLCFINSSTIIQIGSGIGLHQRFGDKVLIHCCHLNSKAGRLCYE